MTILRWGILGPGRIAPRLAAAVRDHPRGELAAVASRDIGRATRFASEHRIPRAFGSYDDLLASPDIDVVYIALPNHLHADWTVRALEAGKHVLCEKPLALTPDDVDRIVSTAARARRIAAEGFMFLHHPQILKAVELARGGALGRLEIVNGTFSFFLSNPDDPRADPEMGGGSLWDVGCYPVSLARRIAGEEPDRVGAFARYDQRGVDRTFLGQMRFPNGLLAQFDSGFAAPDRERIEIVGGDATLLLDAPFLPHPFGLPASLTLWHGRESTPIDIPAVDHYNAEVEDLTAAILDDTPPRIDLAFSRGNVATLVDLDRAARINAGLQAR